MRKIIKLSPYTSHGNPAVCVACDDGTMWYTLLDGGRSKWQQVGPIPQPPTPESGLAYVKRTLAGLGIDYDHEFGELLREAEEIRKKEQEPK